MVGEWGNFWKLREMGQAWGMWKEWGNVGEEWGSVLGCGGGEEKCRECWEVWERCGRVYGVNVEVVGESVLGRGGSGEVCGEVWKSVGEPTHSSAPLPHPLLSPDTSPHPPHTHPTSLPHTHVTHSLHLPQHFPTPPPTLLHYPQTSSDTTPILYHAFTPYQNFSLFSFIAKLV